MPARSVAGSVSSVRGQPSTLIIICRLCTAQSSPLLIVFLWRKPCLVSPCARHLRVARRVCSESGGSCWRLCSVNSSNDSSLIPLLSLLVFAFPTLRLRSLFLFRSPCHDDPREIFVFHKNSSNGSLFCKTSSHRRTRVWRFWE